MTFTLTSDAFGDHARIPARYTCEGSDISPPLQWQDPPRGTKSFALVMDDPDAPDPRAPKMTWVHWVVVDIPGESRQLPENAGRSGLPAGAYQGLNDWKRPSYGGPCPPIGEHRYFFTLYALNTTLPGLGQPTKAQLLGSIEGHVLGQAQLVGTYIKHASSHHERSYPR